MSMAPREAKCTMLSRIRPGHDTLEQYAIASSEGYSTFDLHTGQRSGGAYGFPRRTPFLITGPSTWGITSPARVTSTQSPARMSFVWIRSKLCSVAVVTVTPPISTGSSTA